MAVRYSTRGSFFYSTLLLEDLRGEVTVCENESSGKGRGETISVIVGIFLHLSVVVSGSYFLRMAECVWAGPAWVV